MFDDHYQVDGVKVFLTGKTTGQIGLSLDGCFILSTQGTAEAKDTSDYLSWNAQKVIYHLFYGNMVAHGK